MVSRIVRHRRGQGLVEYGLLLAGVSLVGMVGVSILGHKSSDLIGTTASIMPGAHTDDGGAVYSGHLVQTAQQDDGTGTGTKAIVIDTNAIQGQIGQSALDDNMGLTSTGGAGITDQSFVTDTTPFGGTPVPGN